MSGTVANEEINAGLSDTDSYAYFNEKGQINFIYEEGEIYEIEVYYTPPGGTWTTAVIIEINDYSTFATNTVYSLSSADLGHVSHWTNLNEETYLISAVKILFETYSTKEGGPVAGVAQVELKDGQGSLAIRFDSELHSKIP